MSCHVTLYSSHLRQQIQCYSTCRQIPFSYLDDPSNCMNSMRKLHLPKNRRLLKPKGEGLVQIILPSVSGLCSNPFLSHYLQGLIQPRWCRISIHLYPCAPPYNFKDLIKRVFCFFCQPTWSNPPPKKKKNGRFWSPQLNGWQWRLHLNTFGACRSSIPEASFFWCNASERNTNNFRAWRNDRLEI